MSVSEKNVWSGLFDAARPVQWVKNGFVAAPLLFSGNFTQPRALLDTAGVFAGFCAASSAVYVFNDICDIKADREHPLKSERAIASGRVSTSGAWVFALLLAAAGLGLCSLVSIKAMAAAGIYLIISAAYSKKLKHIVILDVMIIAAGFVLRIAAGGYAASAMPSYWLVLCTIMISLFLGFSKRRAELVSSGKEARPVLNEYSEQFLDKAIVALTAAVIMCYSLYTVDVRTMQLFGSRAMVLTLPCVIYGIFRYLYLVYNLRKGEDPAAALLRDLPMMVNMVIWVLVCLVVILWGPKLGNILAI